MPKSLRRIVELALALAVGFGLGAWWCSPPGGPADAGSPVTTVAPVARPQAPQSEALRPEGRDEARTAELERPRPGDERAAPTPLDGGPTAVNVEPGSGCHVRMSPVAPGSARSERTLSSSVLELTNDCDETVMISWLDFNGAEQRADFVLPNAGWTSNTFRGHVFRVRVADARRSFVRDLVVPRARRSRVFACGCGAAPGALAVDVPEVIDAGEPEARRAPRCPVPFEQEPPVPAASPPSSARVQLKLRNTCEDLRVHMSWVRLDGGLRDAEELEPGVEQDYTSYLGHRFRVYDANTHRWLRDFEIDGGTVVDLCACPGT